MKQTNLIAGEQGIDKQIKWVTVVEVIEDIERLQDGEFLITTGFNLLEDRERLDIFHNLLRSRPVSAVAIYTSFYMEKIPGSFIQLANENALPLIEIPLDINFSEITKELLQYIVNQQTKLLEQAEQVHRELMALILNDRSLSEITGRLSELTNSNIYIFNEFYGIIFSNQETKNKSQSIFIEQKGNIDMKPKLIYSLEKKSIEYLEIENTLFTIYPIIAKQSCFGWIVMEKSKNKQNELDEIAIERATSIYAMEFIKKQAIEETKLRVQNNLLDDIFTIKYSNPQFIIDQGAKFNYDFTLSQSVFHLTFSPYEQTDMQLLDRLYQFIEHFFIQKKRQHMIQMRLQSIILLTNIIDDQDDDDEHMIQLAQELNRQWDYYSPNNSLVIGIGHTYDNISQLGKSAQESQYANQLRDLVDPTKQIIHFKDLGMYQFLLKMHRNKIDLTTIYGETLGDLLSETGRDIDLVETIDTYFRQNQSIKFTAEKLYIHRHTLRYRLNQIEKRTGLHLKLTDDAFKLNFCLMAYKLDTVLKQN